MKMKKGPRPFFLSSCCMFNFFLDSSDFPRSIIYFWLWVSIGDCSWQTLLQLMQFVSKFKDVVLVQDPFHNINFLLKIDLRKFKCKFGMWKKSKVILVIKPAVPKYPLAWLFFRKNLFYRHHSFFSKKGHYFFWKNKNSCYICNRFQREVKWFGSSVG